MVGCNDHSSQKRAVAPDPDPDIPSPREHRTDLILWSGASKLKQYINSMAFNPHVLSKHLFLLSPLSLPLCYSLCGCGSSSSLFCITMDTKSLSYCSSSKAWSMIKHMAAWGGTQIHILLQQLSGMQSTVGSHTE